VKSLLAAVLAGAALLATGATATAKPPSPIEKTLFAAIERAAGAGHVDAQSAGALRNAVGETAALAKRVPPLRADVLDAQLAQVAQLAPKLTTPRALALAGQLAANDAWLGSKRIPAAKTDVADADGIVYRWFPGDGFEFHPLANFGALNADVAGKKTDAATTLAQALLARGVPSGAGTAWEYYFNYAGGRAPWISGMAQAVAAQAFAGASQLTGDSTLMNEARSAYHAIPGRLDRQSSVGLWIKLYSFNRDVVLNAQLQTILSLQAYSGASEDAGAASLASKLEAGAAAALGHFDTGYWSLYALPDDPSPVAYQDYVVQLLHRLASADPRFAAAATRFASYRTQAPAFKLASTGPGAVKFWVSKPSTVTVSALGSSRRLAVSGGWHSVGWTLPKRAGIWEVHVSARDWVGNSAAIEALPIVKVVAPPKAPKLEAAPRLTSGGFTVGVGLDSSSQASLAASTGFSTVQLGVVWPSGATAPDSTTLSTLRAVPSSQQLVLELVADPLPTDPGSLSALAAYAASLAQSLPNLHDILLGPSPTAATAPAYAAALAAVSSALKASSAAPPALGAELDGAVAPKTTLAALAGASAPFDELAFIPAATAASGAWTTADFGSLAAALAADFPGRNPPVLEDLFADSTLVPADKASLYQQPLATTGDTEAGQAAAYAGEVSAAACRTGVAGLLFASLVDSPAPGQQTGLYYPDGTPKASAAAVKAAIAKLATGTTCSGTTPAPTPTPSPTPTPTPAPAPSEAVAGTVTFPTTLSTGTPPAVSVACTRDCLYLVTLEQAGSGLPVLATRGALTGGAAATTVRLPGVRFAAGSYRLTVRLVAQASPGPLSTQSSPVLTAP